MILLALDPMASVYSYGLSIKCKLVIVIARIDIEYEWFKLNAKNKTVILGKYVNEQ